MAVLLLTFGFVSSAGSPARNAHPTRQMRMFDVSHRCAWARIRQVPFGGFTAAVTRRDGKSGWRLTSFKIGTALISVGTGRRRWAVDPEMNEPRGARTTRTTRTSGSGHWTTFFWQRELGCPASVARSCVICIWDQPRWPSLRVQFATG